MHPFFKRRDLELQLGNLGPLQIVTVASRCDPARFVIGRIRDRSEYDRPGDDTEQQSSDEDCKDRHRSDRYDIIPIHSQVALLPTFVLDKTPRLRAHRLSYIFRTGAPVHRESRPLLTTRARRGMQESLRS